MCVTRVRVQGRHHGMQVQSHETTTLTFSSSGVMYSCCSGSIGPPRACEGSSFFTPMRFSICSSTYFCLYCHECKVFNRQTPTCAEQLQDVQATHRLCICRAAARNAKTQRLCTPGSHVRIQLNVAELPHLLLGEGVQHIVLRSHAALQCLRDSSRLQPSVPDVQVQSIVTLARPASKWTHRDQGGALNSKRRGICSLQTRQDSMPSGTSSSTSAASLHVRSQT